MYKQNYTEVNSKTWDKWAENGCEWSQPISHEECIKAKAGEWGVYLFNDDGTLPLTVVNKLPFNPLKANEEEYKRMADNYEGVQFSHSLEEQIGGQLKAGFILTDLYEDRDREGCGILREYAPQYIATRALKK